MKRILSVFIALCLAVCIFSLTACEDEPDLPNAPETDAPETDAPETDAPETDAPETDAPETDAPDDNNDIESIFLRNSIVAETKNFKVNGAMMSYLFSANVQSFSTYLFLLGVDTSISLKEQSCALTAGGTWFDYIMEITKSQITEILVFAQGAKDVGVELSADEQHALDVAIENIELEAKAYGYTDTEAYLRDLTGNSIRLADVRDCLELNTLANKYFTQLIDSVQPTHEEREAYYAKNADLFNYVDLYKYDVFSGDFDGTDEAQQSALAKTYVEQLAAIEGVDNFTSAIRAEIEKLTIKRDNETDEQFKERKEALLESVSGEFTSIMDMSHELAEWAKSAEIGDTYVECIDGSTYTVYMLAKTPYRNEEMSRNVRHILFSSDKYTTSEEAQKVLDQFVAAGATEEEFARLAKEYSDDTTADLGGLIENVTKGQMVEEFEKWMFDEARQVGDCGIVESYYGWHIMFYPGEGSLASWEVIADNAIAQEAVEEYFAEKSENITFNQSAIDRINA